MQIRQLKEDDVPLLTLLEAKCFGSYYTEHCFNESQFRAYLYKKKAVLFVAVTNSDPIGYIAGTFMTRQSQDYVQIDSIAVFPSFQQKGIGSTLLKRFISEAENRKCFYINLQVAVINVSGVKFFEKHGFRIIRRLRSYYTAECDAFLMKRTF